MLSAAALGESECSCCSFRKQNSHRRSLDNNRAEAYGFKKCFNLCVLKVLFIFLKSENVENYFCIGVLLKYQSNRLLIFWKSIPSGFFIFFLFYDFMIKKPVSFSKKLFLQNDSRLLQIRL